MVSFSDSSFARMTCSQIFLGNPVGYIMVPAHI